MKLLIPDIGQTLTLEKPWSFFLYPTCENAAFMVATGLAEHFSVDHQPGFGGEPRHSPEEVAAEEKERDRQQRLLRATGTGAWAHNLIRWKSVPLNEHTGNRRYSFLGKIPLHERFRLPGGAKLKVGRFRVSRAGTALTFIIDRRTFPLAGARKGSTLRLWVPLKEAQGMEVSEVL